MKKMIFSTIVLLAVLFALLFILISSMNNLIEDEEKKYKTRIGQEFIFGKDTLKIIDYSLLLESFTMSNGVKVNSSLVFNQDSVLTKSQ